VSRLDSGFVSSNCPIMFCLLQNKLPAVAFNTSSDSMASNTLLTALQGERETKKSR